MILIILEVLWFFLPALVANMAPVFAANVPLLNVPLDGGVRLRGRRLLGDNKTVRGLVVGILFGSITALIQYFFQPVSAIETITLVPQSSALFAIGWGALLGFGALCGDALKSFVKRQLDIAPGQAWRPFDQIDVVVGVLLLTRWWWPLSLAHMITAFIVVGVLSYVASMIGVVLRIKKSI